MATEQNDQEQVAELSVEELRRKYDELCISYDQLRVKVLTFITGELALTTFLFSSGIALPKVIYGLIFFLTGIGCVTASFVLLLLSLRSMDWLAPLSVNTLSGTAKDFENRLALLGHMRDSYGHVISHNRAKVDSKQRTFDKSLLLLFVGAIILLVIKYGQGAIIWQNIIQR